MPAVVESREKIIVPPHRLLRRRFLTARGEAFTVTATEGTVNGDGSGKMRAPNKRLKRERETIERMIALFCRDHHRSSGDPCAECAELAEYAKHRLDKCPFEDQKPTCAKCPVHCYKPARREQIRMVMRYAGPRLLFRHPVLAIRHKLEERKKPPAHPRPGRRAAVDAAPRSRL